MFWVIIRLLVEYRAVLVCKPVDWDTRQRRILAGSSLFWSKPRLPPAMLGGRRAVVIIFQTFAIAFLDPQSLI